MAIRPLAFGVKLRDKTTGRTVRVTTPSMGEDEMIRYTEILRIDVPDEGLDEDELFVQAQYVF